MSNSKSKEAGGKLIKERKEEVTLSLNVIEHCVRIATGCGLGNRGSIPGRIKTSFSSPKCPDRLWAPPNAVSNGYRG
jgi:hypothetical protein